MRAVITYRCLPSRAAGGQQIGVDGSGNYAIIYEGSDDIKLNECVWQRAKELANYRNIVDVECIIEESAYPGQFIQYNNIDDPQ